jgi:hypothetical protein
LGWGMCERIAAILQVKEGFRRLHKGWGKVCHHRSAFDYSAQRIGKEEEIREE